MLEPAAAAQLPVAFHAAAEVIRSNDVDYHVYTSLPYLERCYTNAYWRLPTYAAPPLGSVAAGAVQEPRNPSVRLMMDRLCAIWTVSLALVSHSWATFFLFTCEWERYKLGKARRMEENAQQAQAIKEELLRRGSRH